jgi:dual-specificity kinase
LKKVFVYNPEKRITAKQALKHPWFKETLQDDGTEAARIRDEKAEHKRRQQENETRRQAAYH